MDYFLIQLNTLPAVLFAHTHETESYHFQRLKTVEMTEISYYETGTVEKNESDHIRYVVPGSVEISLPGSEFTQKCTEGLHRHITAGFDIQFAQTSITEDEIAEKYRLSEENDNQLPGEKPVFILPKSIAPGKNAEFVHKALIKIQKAYIETDKLIRSSVCAGLALSLLSDITSFCLEEILSGHPEDAGRPSNMIYMKTFYRYVNAHINENITCAEIAQTMGITQGYLSKIVMDETGQSPKTKINFMKLEKAVDLCRIQGLTFSEAGRIVGFEDAHYLSRLFKKYYGMSYREYTKIRFRGLYT